MVITALDTYQLVKELRAVGFTDEQAETLVSVLRKMRTLSSSAASGHVDALIADLRASIAKFKVDLVTAMFWQTVVIIGATVALLKMVLH